MNDPVYQRLREIAWRRKLTEAEEVELRAWLAAHPEAAAECEVEFALSDALAKLPDAPVATNFTARVLQGIEREEMRPTPRGRDWRWFWRVVLPRTAVAALLVGGSLFGYHQFKLSQQRAVRESLLAVAEVKELPPDVLANFDAIQKLSTESVADKELLALLQ